MSTVVSFAFVVVGQTDKAYDRAFKILCFVYCFRVKSFVVSVAFKGIAFGVIEFLSAFCQTICERQEFIRVYPAASRTLVAAVFSQRADDQKVVFFVGGEQVFVVFEKDYAFFCDASCQFVRAFVIGLIIVLARFFAFK